MKKYLLLMLPIMLAGSARASEKTDWAKKIVDATHPFYAYVTANYAYVMHSAAFWMKEDEEKKTNYRLLGHKLVHGENGGYPTDSEFKEFKINLENLLQALISQKLSNNKNRSKCHDRLKWLAKTFPSEKVFFRGSNSEKGIEFSLKDCENLSTFEEKKEKIKEFISGKQKFSLSQAKTHYLLIQKAIKHTAPENEKEEGIEGEGN